MPKWSGPIPDENYSFEILKNGIIIGGVRDLQTKPFWIFGRMKLGMDNSLIAEHPSVSRYHAVLQYKTFDDDNKDESDQVAENGWFIYDLGESST